VHRTEEPMSALPDFSRLEVALIQQQDALMKALTHRVCGTQSEALNQQTWQHHKS
jgi:hypothetical protein